MKTYISIPKKLFLLTALIGGTTFADVTGVYVGGGAGYGMQNISGQGNTANLGSPALRAFFGYQFADWVGAEAGYTYISQANNWNNLGAPSATIYDIAFTPGFVIPATPVAIYTRLGIDGVSANLNSSWSNQVFSNMGANFEWGLGAKIVIPGTHTFVRAEYTNYGSVTNNNNSNVTTLPSTIMVNAAYVF